MFAAARRRAQSPGQALERGHGQRAEERNGREHLQLLLGHVGGRVDAAEVPVARGGEHGEDAAGDDERRAGSELVDEQRAEDRADADGGDDEDLEDAEHAGEDGVVDPALDHREARDVEDGVPGADHGQAEERPEDVRPGGDERDRRAPEDESAGERARQPSPADEPQADEAARQRAGAEGGVEEADARVARVEQLEGCDDEEDVEHAPDERLGREQADHEARARFVRQRARAREDVFDRPVPPGGDERAGREPRDLECRPERDGGADREDDVEAAERQQDSCERRADEDGDALERARGDVRRDELLRRARERRDDREV